MLHSTRVRQACMPRGDCARYERLSLLALQEDTTPFFEACRNGHFKIMEDLVEKGADITAKMTVRLGEGVACLAASSATTRC